MKQWFLKELIEKQEQLNTDSADLALNFKELWFAIWFFVYLN